MQVHQRSMMALQYPHNSPGHNINISTRNSFKHNAFLPSHPFQNDALFLALFLHNASFPPPLKLTQCFTSSLHLQNDALFPSPFLHNASFPTPLTLAECFPSLSSFPNALFPSPFLHNASFPTHLKFTEYFPSLSSFPKRCFVSLSCEI